MYEYTHTLTHTHSAYQHTHLEVHPQIPADGVAHPGLAHVVGLVDEVVDVEQVPLPVGVAVPCRGVGWGGEWGGSW